MRHCHLYPLYFGSTLGDHVQEFKVKWGGTKKFYTEPLKEDVSLQ